MKKNTVKPGASKLQIRSQRIRTLAGGELSNVFGGAPVDPGTGFKTSHSELWSTCGTICCP